ncbi:hypothetical protein DMENIID0001_091490 [Sergentomyia squamirostris]
MDVHNTVDLIIHTHGDITRIGESFSKLGPARRKAKGLTYYQDTLLEVTKHWAELQDLHNLLITHIADNHYYHAEGVYKKAEHSFTRIKKLIERTMVTDFAPTPQPPSTPSRTNEEILSLREGENAEEQLLPNLNMTNPFRQINDGARSTFSNGGSPTLNNGANTKHLEIASSTPNGGHGHSSDQHENQDQLRATLMQQLAAINATFAEMEEREQAQENIHTAPTAPMHQPPIQMETQRNSIDHTLQSTHNYYNQLPKLPAIQIKKFNGDEKEWPMFFELFSSVFHENPTLSAIQKMQYLMSYLEGPPKKLVSHLTLNRANYESALTILKSRYENKRQMVTTYVNSIIMFKKVTPGSADEIIRLHDCINSCLAGLKNLGYRTDTWDPILVSIICQKFDADTVKAFEEGIKDITEIPTISELLLFLLKRYRVLRSSPKDQQANKNKDTKETKKSFHLNQKTKHSCPQCKKDHPIFRCEEFKKLSTYDRNQQVKTFQLCSNCLCHKKDVPCKSQFKCLTCQKRHHTLLHFDKKSDQEKNNVKNLHVTADNKTNDLESDSDSGAASFHSNVTSVILPTAVIKVKGKNGSYQHLRALLDTGSGDAYITEAAVQSLGLSKTKISTSITGIGGASAGRCKALVELLFTPRFQSNFKGKTKAFVLPTLTSKLPSTLHKIKMDIQELETLKLADPEFYKPAAIDIILSANVYAGILKNEISKDLYGFCAQNTELGWVVMGKSANSFHVTTQESYISIAELDHNLRTFWEMDVNTTSTSELEEECEKHFKETHSRNADGRYKVKLPFKSNNEVDLGESRKKAVARLLSMERKFSKEPILKQMYTEFMREYQELGHSSPKPDYTGPASGVFYLPHHAVFKEDSTTTKLRVVFDASSKSSTGVSLNDLLHTGPKIQEDLRNILTRWRKYRYVYTADAEKMFRQVELDEKDRNYTRILWRESARDPIQEFQLNTVTYGTGPATFLSVRVLHQLATDEVENYPLASKVLLRDFYVDDMLTGAHTFGEAVTLQQQIRELLARGKFNLRKWTSNSKELLVQIPEESREKGIIEIKEDETIKPLGVHWSPILDQFQFSIKLNPKRQVTKRAIASEVAKIFDPTGWLAAIMLRGKLIMQEMWRDKVEWDEEPSPVIIKLWSDFKIDIKHIEDLRISRWTSFTPNSTVQIHGFADASEKAYAACIYLRVQTNSTVNIHLLTAKTRVAPLKGKISLPRLELCAATLLAELMPTTIAALDVEIESVHAWSDSQIVLAWIKRDPSTWDTYVSNRVAKIHSKFPREIWNHVVSEENPADIATRQIAAKHIKEKKLWWRGPSWLRQEPHTWPMHQGAALREIEEQMMIAQNCLFTVSMYQNEEDIEAATKSMAKQETDKEKINSFYGQFSSIHKLIKIVGYCLRFKKNGSSAPKDRIRQNTLTHEEYQKAKSHVFRQIQEIHFSDELNDLRKGKNVSPKSKLKDLNPILIDDLIRVGGRIQNSQLQAETKHPIILPKCHVTSLLIMDTHKAMLHGGMQLTLAQIKRKYWIMKGRSYVKSVVSKCMSCSKCRGLTFQQIMGNLPTERITPAPPFSRCGVDYAGPILTRRNKGRGNMNEKSYIAVFICLVTKAVHLEAVTDLSTDAFLAALKRFIARRGKPALIMSDNGTNFVGAQRVLDKETARAAKLAAEKASKVLLEDGIEWKFIPPGAPHFGGIWEAAVKSIKFHIVRTIGLTKLTYEELATLLSQIEACLNSRPLTPLSNDPRDVDALTPGHFLIGRALTGPPETDASELSPTNRWKLITKLHQQIWTKWAREYLTTLQQRTKWKDSKDSPSVGQLVLLKEDNMAPLRWPLARLLALHPGPDGHVRVATIRLRGTKTKKAPVHKLCQLPHEEADLEIHEREAIPSKYVSPYDPPFVKIKKTATTEQKINKRRKKDTSTPSKSRPVTRAHARTILLTIIHVLVMMTSVLGHNYTLTKPDPAEQKLKMFSERVDQVSKAMNEVQLSSNHVFLEMKMLTAYLGAINYLDEIKEKYMTILRVYTHQGNGIRLITQKQLKERITKAHEKMNADLMVSTQLQQTTSISCHHGDIIVHLFLPIIETTAYDLIHTTSIPQHITNNTFTIQDIEHPLIGMNFHEQKYFSITTEEIKNCQRIQPATLICQVEVLCNILEHASCMINQILDKKNEERCPIKKVTLKDILWKKMSVENSWLYIVEKPTLIAVICSGFREEVTINTTGIIQIKRDCLIKTKTFTLTSTTNEMEAKVIYARKIIFPEINVTEFQEKIPTLLDSSSIIKSSEAIFGKAATSVPTVIAMKTINLPKHTPYTISGVICFIILTYVAWRTRTEWIAMVKRCFPSHNVNPEVEIYDVPARQAEIRERLRNIAEIRSCPPDISPWAQHVRTEHV